MAKEKYEIEVRDNKSGKIKTLTFDLHSEAKAEHAKLEAKGGQRVSKIKPVAHVKVPIPNQKR
ncbi:MAG: hypothetical protein AABZ31_00390 [Bdellovibrionota bacterium]